MRLLKYFSACVVVGFVVCAFAYGFQLLAWEIIGWLDVPSGGAIAFCIDFTFKIGGMALMALGFFIISGLIKELNDGR
ncbi:hypothetical protein SAMN05421665_3510 [Yoonia rosea]|uniref:Uncharacterized protein n=1 Tax=Yoonia rosea TaxID=287098 RepID=A0A1R3XLB7_9RHOB|nr:hypothetical protein [Yoonia rosea]SIT91891.1 hypothetical protein SAMN05421665_3510 [Yoonia rosea]